MIQWGILAIFFKTIGWAIAVLVAAKGNSKHLFWNELIANGYLLIFNIVGYYMYGLTGLGGSFLVGYFIYFLQIYLFTKLKYRFVLQPKIIINFLIFLLVGILCFIVANSFEGIYSYLIGGILVLFTSAYSLYQVDKRMQIIQMIKSKLKS